MRLCPPLSAAALLLCLALPLPLTAAPATLPEGFAEIAARHALPFDPAAGTPGADGQSTSYTLEHAGHSHSLRFADCSALGCGQITLTSHLRNVAGLNSTQLTALLTQGSLAAFFEPPLRNTLKLREDHLFIETRFDTGEAAALDAALGTWQQAVTGLASGLATLQPAPATPPLTTPQPAPPVFSPEALQAALEPLGATMAPDSEGGAKLPTDERSFMVSGAGPSYLAVFSGCRATGCSGLSLHGVLANPGRLTGPAFSAIYDDGRFAFLGQSDIAHAVTPRPSTVAVRADVWPEVGADPIRLARGLASFHRYLSTLEAALAEAPPAIDPLDLTARTPDELAALLTALGYPATAGRNGGRPVVRVTSGTPQPPLIYLQGCRSADDPASCRFLIFSTALPLEEHPDRPGMDSYNARSFCCKAIWQAADKRLLHTMSLPLQPGVDAALMRESMLIFTSQQRVFDRTFARPE